MALAENQIHESVLKESRSESRTRDHILALTPIGTSPTETFKAISREFPGTVPWGYKQHLYMASPEPPHARIYIHGCIGLDLDSRGWLDLVMTRKMIVWYFDAEDLLFNVTVHEGLIGP